MDKYQQFLAIGKKNICQDQDCGQQFKKQLQDLHDFVYVVDSTPHPYERTYFPMFIHCILHKDLWTSSIHQQLQSHHYSYELVDYSTNRKYFYHLPDTSKRKLLFEMVSQWWFFPYTLSPLYVRTEVLEFRDHFFKQKFAYLPEKFRMFTETMDFNSAMNLLTQEEHDFLDDFLEQLALPSTRCGCLPVRKSAFSRRFQEPIWYHLPDLRIGNRPLEMEIREAFFSGELFLLSIHNYYDGLDRNLYKKLYEIFSNCGKAK